MADIPTTIASVPVSFGETIGDPVAEAGSESSTGLGSMLTGRTDRVWVMASDAASVSVAVKTGGVATAAATETGAVVVAPLAEVVVRLVLGDAEDVVGELDPVELDPDELDPDGEDAATGGVLAGGVAAGWAGELATGAGLAVAVGGGAGLGLCTGGATTGSDGAGSVGVSVGVGCWATVV